ncbi:MAG: methyltransferase domain-containing protein [Prosthecobacter sp.]|uniref:class I SAM-dependent methyltransferase n=1 Tax=Prosthecobacter sp. TaxID=1965333 RepID=UPI0025DA2A7F|nr:class I SAM-dependent methyltransferase [Prosthecobacter sp.]MCF7787195.1 methyltransferase domain-containing protein [Prosthecobacter sp.]
MMNTRLPSRALKRITRLCARRRERFYAVAKLRSDPVYAAVTKELLGSPLPVLDIGCGIGLLAFYLRESGCVPAIAGFDYDEEKITCAQSMTSLSGFEGLSFMTGDARTGLPEYSGHVVILDILQFFTREEQEALLSAAASRVAQGGKLIIRTCLQNDSLRFRITVAGDWLARLTNWMKAAPVCYPDRALFESVLGAAGLRVEVQPLWGGTPFNNHLVVAERE